MLTQAAEKVLWALKTANFGGSKMYPGCPIIACSASNRFVVFASAVAKDFFRSL